MLRFRTLRWLVLAMAVLSMQVFGPSTSKASIQTFDAATDLTSNFDLNILPGDSFVAWRSGYAPSGSFSGSDGGFAHFNSYPPSDSIGFKIGEVYLNSFDISSQYSGGGAGVSQANLAGDDYRLNLYDSGLTLISTVDYFLPSNGDWTTVTVNTPGVYAIQIVNAMGINPSQGYWPNMDNLVFNEGVPEPTTAVIWSMFAGLGFVSYRRRRRS